MTPRSFIIPGLAFAASMLPLQAVAQVGPAAQLVADLNRTPAGHDAQIQWVMPVQGGVVFAMKTIAQGHELWFSDGTTGGTRLLMDIEPGQGNSYPMRPVQVGEKVAFVTEDASQMEKLWITDGTAAGTVMLLDTAALSPEGGTGEIQMQGGMAGGVFFRVRYENPGVSYALWFSNGTVAGTQALSPLVPGLESGAYSFRERDGQMYFGVEGDRIFCSDGTAAGTTSIVDAGALTDGGSLISFEMTDSRFYLRVGRSYQGDSVEELWTCTRQGTDAVRIGSGIWWEVDEMKAWEQGLTFVVVTESLSRQFWHTDGTPAGTHQLPMMHKKVQFTPGELVEMDRFLYFGGYSERSHMLWRTDGTPEGTRPVTGPRIRTVGGPVHLQVAGSYLYYQQQGADTRWEMWRSDGTARGTKRVSRMKDYHAFGGSGPLYATWQDRFFFAAGRGTPENALWITKPKGVGALPLTTPEPGGNMGAFDSGWKGSYEAVNGSILAFAYSEGYSSPKLWRVSEDGSPRVIWKPRGLLASTGGNYFAAKLGEKALFTTPSLNLAPAEVWITDGTAKGTKRLVRHTQYQELSDFTVAGDLLYYRVNDLTDPLKSGLWRTDGTAAGTAQVVAWDFTRPQARPGELVAFNGMLYFMSGMASGSLALWRSDGTEEGTERVKQFPQASTSTNTRRSLAVIGDQLAFSVGGIYYEQLWRSDGTEAGTVSYGNPYVTFLAGNVSLSVDLDGLQLFAAMGSFGAPFQWYRSDGTPQGVQPLIPDLSRYHTDSPGDTAVTGGLMFYRGAKDEGWGSVGSDLELWVANGSVGGSRQVKDIRPGSRSSSPANFIAVGNVVYFTAETDEHGRELWKSDGTEAGTVLVWDLLPGPEGSAPQELKLLGDKLYFTATSLATGRELFSVAVE
ncbi:hypothetical protein OJ996_22305 [Luteolibacter sp. GHJ8]|uniref:ELWxxDGT repeat protein n=1 Tax=Luteolibacter rhizosphaerae TaxID=2989719 RepID=A0ABT3G913_9BACT|nr:ELWxxDGT repeat protein [Luteolibacter rhizosphaerae]MCW1916338.1 hypothetical protein [Luteolibacter rhizosphaerae]